MLAECQIGLGHKTVFYSQVTGNHYKISKAVHIVIHKYLKGSRGDLWPPACGIRGQTGSSAPTEPSDCVKNVILSEAKDLKWPENEILRYTQNDKKREKCFFTQPAVKECFRVFVGVDDPVHPLSVHIF